MKKTMTDWVEHEHLAIKGALCSHCASHDLKYFVRYNTGGDLIQYRYFCCNCMQYGETYERYADLLDAVTEKEANVEKDNVNHPSHYTDGKIEVIDYIEDKQLNYHRGNAIKYISRAGKKNPEKEIEDLEKAHWYINREIERLTGKKRKQVNIALEKSLTSKNFYLTINDTFYLEITEKTFYELAEFVGINVQ